MLTKVKDRLPEKKRSKFVYRISCDCGRVYIGETIRRFETRLKEHKEAHRKADTDTSVVAEHSWNTQHAIQWGETTILDQARRTKELKIKEALHIMTSSHQRLNRDKGLEGDNEADGRRARLHLWSHPQDACILSVQCIPLSSAIFCT